MPKNKREEQIELLNKRIKIDDAAIEQQKEVVQIHSKAKETAEAAIAKLRQTVLTNRLELEVLETQWKWLLVELKYDDNDGTIHVEGAVRYKTKQLAVEAAKACKCSNFHEVVCFTDTL